MIMKFLRKKKNMKIILWVVAIFIIPGFLIWGLGVGGSKSPYYAAVVNRKPITLKEYYQRLSETEKRYREIFGDKAEEFFKSMNIEQGILENMIREKILLQQAKRRRIKVLNSEVVEVVKSEPVFRDEKGHFDEKKFREVISSYKSEELRKIEDDIREKIMMEKLKELVISEGNVTVSDKEVADYIKNHQLTDADRESIRRTLLWQKREEYFGNWYSDVRKNSNVKIYLSLEKEQPSTGTSSNGSNTAE